MEVEADADWWWFWEGTMYLDWISVRVYYTVAENVGWEIVDSHQYATDYWISKIYEKYTVSKYINRNNNCLYLLAESMFPASPASKIYTDYVMLDVSYPENATPPVQGDNCFVDASTGTIEYMPNNNYLAKTKYIYEHGAIIASQDNYFSYMDSEPDVLHITYDDSTDRTTIRINVIALKSNLQSISDPSVITLGAYPLENEVTLIGYTENLTLTVGTSYPDLWEDYFEKEMGNAGDNVSWSVNTTGDSVILNVYKGNGPKIKLAYSKYEVEPRIIERLVR